MAHIVRHFYLYNHNKYKVIVMTRTNKLILGAEFWVPRYWQVVPATLKSIKLSSGCTDAERQLSN